MLKDEAARQIILRYHTRIRAGERDIERLKKD
jgi:hypothetical protein